MSRTMLHERWWRMKCLGLSRLGLFGAVMALGVTASALAGFEDDYEAQKWAEVEVQLPAPPKQENLVSFYVSETTENRFFVDPGSISVGSDGVVRYTLVVVSSGGVRNVSFEGVRCETLEKRLYAFGHADGSWAKSRSNQWERVRDIGRNRHHAALIKEFFCPDGGIVRNADEARERLRRGGSEERRG